MNIGRPVLQRVDDVNLVFDRHRREHRQGGDYFESVDEAILVRVKQDVKAVPLAFPFLKQRRKLPTPERKSNNRDMIQRDASQRER